MLSFAQYIQLQRAFMPPAPSTRNVGKTPQTFFGQATRHATGPRVHDVYQTSDGATFSTQYAFAVPLKKPFEPYNK